MAALVAGGDAGIWVARHLGLGDAYLFTWKWIRWPVTAVAAAPVIEKYTGVLAAADIEEFTLTTTFQIMQSLRLDKGPSGPVHP